MNFVPLSTTNDQDITLTGGLSLWTRLSQLSPNITVFSASSSLLVKEHADPMIQPDVSTTCLPTVAERVKCGTVEQVKGKLY